LAFFSQGGGEKGKAILRLQCPNERHSEEKPIIVEGNVLKNEREEGG